MKYRKIKPEDIQVADAYQRPVKGSHVSGIVKCYNPEAFGVLVVGCREDGSHWCVDGQTRRLAAIKLGLLEVPCLVFDSLGKQHEAAIFRQLNRQRNMSLIDRLRALSEEGDPNTLEMIDIVGREGFRISFDGSRAWPNIRAVSPVETAYSIGVLTDVLRTITIAWGGVQDVYALQVPTIGGLTRFFAKHGTVIVPEMLGPFLQRYAVIELVAQCNARKMQGGGREHAMYEVIVLAWNKANKPKLDLV